MASISTSSFGSSILDSMVSRRRVMNSSSFRDVAMDHRYVTGVYVFLYRSAEIRAVHSRHHQVRDYKINHFHAKNRQGLFSLYYQ